MIYNLLFSIFPLYTSYTYLYFIIAYIVYKVFLVPIQAVLYTQYTWYFLLEFGLRVPEFQMTSHGSLSSESKNSKGSPIVILSSECQNYSTYPPMDILSDFDFTKNTQI